MKATKNIRCMNGEDSWWQYSNQMVEEISRILTINQGQVDIKQWILRLCFKPCDKSGE